MSEFQMMKAMLKRESEKCEFEICIMPNEYLIVVYGNYDYVIEFHFDTEGRFIKSY